jgi:hypothetical protein
VGKIDKERFRRVMERAIELDADRDETLDERDLLAAGREIGLSEDSVREALAQIEAEEGAPPPEFGRPFDTDVALQVGESLTLRVPGPGLTRDSAVAGLFMTAWLTFAMAWTIGAAMASTWFALWGMLFVMVGLRGMGEWIRGVWQTDELRIEGDRAVLASRVGPVRWQTAMKAQHLRAAWKPEVASGSGKRKGTTPAHLVLEHGTRTLQLMSGRSEAELRWVNEELGRWLLTGGRSRG